MRRHSRWAATTATLLALAIASSVSHARDHARVPLPLPAPAAIRAPQRLAQVPPAPEVPPAATQSSPEISQQPSDAPPTPPPADVPPEVPVPPAAKPAPSAVMLDPRDAQAILGKSVRSSAGEDMGRLVDVVVDRNGQPRAAVIDFGGFLGVGSRKIAVDWTMLKFMRDEGKQNVVTVELTKDQVTAAPEFKEGSAVVILGALGNAQPPPAASPPAWPEK
jgi:PRC-barrel domain